MLEALRGFELISWRGRHVLNHTGEVGVCVDGTIKITFRKLNSILMDGSVHAIVMIGGRGCKRAHLDPRTNRLR
jgi:hypothetical protein